MLNEFKYSSNDLRYDVGTKSIYVWMDKQVIVDGLQKETFQLNQFYLKTEYYL